MFLSFLCLIQTNVIGKTLFIKGDSVLSAEDLEGIDKDVIETVRIDEGISKINEHCFKGFDNLENAYLPDSIRDFDPTTFDDCPNLVEIFSDRGSIEPNDYEDIDEITDFKGEIPVFPWIVSIVLLSLLVFVLSYFGDELKARNQIILDLRKREKQIGSFSAAEAEELVEIVKSLGGDEHAIELAETLCAKVKRIE